MMQKGMTGDQEASLYEPVKAPASLLRKTFDITLNRQAIYGKPLCQDKLLFTYYMAEDALEDLTS